MTPAQTGAQTGLWRGVAALAACAAATTPPVSSGSNATTFTDPNRALVRCVQLLQAAEGDMGELANDDPARANLAAYRDALLAQAVELHPTTDRGIGAKAEIALVYADTPAGERVGVRLLSDLVIRGRG